MVDMTSEKKLYLISHDIEMDAQYITDKFVKGQLSQYKKTHKRGYWGGVRDKSGNYTKHWSCNWSKDLRPSETGEGVFFPLGTNTYTKDYPWDCCNPVFVVDIDYYKDGFENSKFYKRFGDPLEYFKDTLIVRTGKGGLHLYFKEIIGLAAQNGLDNGLIDIKSGWKNDGEPGQAFVVGFGSEVKYTEADRKKYNLPSRIGEYKVISANANNIQQAPEEIINYISSFNTKKFTSISQKCGKKVMPCNIPGVNHFDCPDVILDGVCKQLAKKDIEYFQGNFKKWLIFTTAMKSISKFKIWNKYCQIYGEGSYDKYNNIAIWNSHLKYSGDINCLKSILNVIGRVELIDKFQFKPIIKHDIKFDTSEKMKGYLSDNLMMFEGESYAIKSPTGTGKTKLVKDYFNETGCKFIDIVSRKSLCDDHIRAFRDEGIECIDYQEVDGLIQEGNVVVQIDSLVRCVDIIKSDEIKDYTLFVDEFTSVLEHLNISPTLNSKKCGIYNLLEYMITNCKNVIVVDADLEGLSLDFIEKVCGREIHKVENKRESFQNLECKEYTDIEYFYEELRKRDKFMFCTDSLTLAKTCIEKFRVEEGEDIKVEKKKYVLDNEVVNEVEITYIKDEKGKIVLISGDNAYCPDLDKHKRVIFSPKIIYGVDSTMERDVFAAYKENSINAKMMMQQIARCRNPTYLHFIFLKKKYKESKYDSLDDVKQEQNFLLGLTDVKCNCSKRVLDYYLNHRAHIIYNNDCFRTNQYAHVKYLMKSKNFKITNEIVGGKETDAWRYMSDCGDMSRYNVVNFEPTPKMIQDIDKYKPISMPDGCRPLITHNETHWNPDCVVSKEQIVKYCYYFLSKHQMQSLYRVFNWFFKNTDLDWDRIKHNEQYTPVDRACHDTYRLWFLKEIMIKAGCRNKIDIITTNDYVLSEIEKKECKRLYRVPEKRLQKPTQDIIISIFKSLFSPHKIRKNTEQCEALLKKYNREKEIYEAELMDGGFVGKKPKKPDFYYTIPIIITTRIQMNKKRMKEHHMNEDWLEKMYLHFSDKVCEGGIDLQDDYTKHDWNFNNNFYKINTDWIDDYKFINDIDSGLEDTCSETSASTMSSASMDRPRFITRRLRISL